MSILNRLFDWVYDYYDKESDDIYLKRRVTSYYGLRGIKTITHKIPFEFSEFAPSFISDGYISISKEEYIRLGGEV